jgi:hypothetical protein
LIKARLIKYDPPSFEGGAIMFKSLVLSCVLLIASAASAHADTTVFTDRAAFERAAYPNITLKVTNVDVRSSGDIRITYSDILTVGYDNRGLLLISGCYTVGCVGSIPQGGDPFGNTYVTVGQFATPVYAVGYEVIGQFKLNGINVTATETTPAFFGFVFDQPTTALPLPEIALYPNPPFIPIQGVYNVTNIRVRTTPEAVPPDPKQLLSDLMSTVIDMNLPAGINNSLNAKLSAAIAALDDGKAGKDAATINILLVFINAVEAQRGKEFTNTQADSLVRSAEVIISVLTQ